MPPESDSVKTIRASLRWIVAQEEAKPFVAFLRTQLRRLPFRKGDTLELVAHRAGQMAMALLILIFAGLEQATPEPEDENA